MKEQLEYGVMKITPPEEFDSKKVHARRSETTLKIGLGK